ncbi:hypothetical protein GPALN_011698 [Globodera pallida]|nr:hypothetical protein GPALN_011698 [Globodera pallida]
MKYFAVQNWHLATLILVDDNRHGRLPLFALGDGLRLSSFHSQTGVAPKGHQFMLKYRQDKASVERFNVFMGEPKPKQEKRRSSTTVTNAKQRKSVV